MLKNRTTDTHLEVDTRSYKKKKEKKTSLRNDDVYPELKLDIVRSHSGPHTLTKPYSSTAYSSLLVLAYL